jgi:hypothetical protein
MVDAVQAGRGVVDYPGLYPNATGTVIGNLSGSTVIPGPITLAELAAAMGSTSYQGTWNAATNTPALASGVGTNGYYYVVSVAGTTNLNGIADWSVGDWAIYNGTVSAWQKVEGGATTMTVGTTVVTGGTNTKVLYNNSGTLGEYTVSGSGNVAMTTSPVLTTPSLGVATATTMAITGVTYANLPVAGTAGRMVFCTNFGTKGNMMWDDGTRWKTLTRPAPLSSLDTSSSAINASETIVHQYQLPAASWRVGDRIRITAMVTKSGTTNTGSLYVRIGTAGTTSDQGLYSTSAMSASQRQGSVIWEIILINATTALIVTRNDLGYGGSTTNSPPSSTTISNVSNALYVSFAIQGGGTDSVTATNVMIDYVPSAN